MILLRAYSCIVVLLLLAMPRTVMSQSVTASYHNTPLSGVLNDIGQKYQVTFAFDNNLLDKVVINHSFANQPLDLVLSTLLEGTGLEVSKSANVYMVVPRPAPSTAGVPAQAPAPAVANKPRAMCLVTGVVKDFKTGEQLPYATVFIGGTNIGTTTNNSGYFSLIANACDSADIMVHYIGYKPMKKRVAARENPQVMTFMVENEVTDLTEIVVEKKTVMLESQLMHDPSRLKLNTSRLSELPSISKLDISAPLQLMPGIDGSTETSSGFLIRKSQDDKNLILYDGFNMYHIDHFFGSFSSINCKAVKDIQVYKSGYDASYGGRTAGLIEITGKSGNMNKPVVDASIDMLSADASIELPLVKDHLSLIVAGRRSFTDLVKTPLYVKLFDNVRYDMKQYYRTYPQAFKDNDNDPVFYYADLHSKITFKARDNHVFSLTYFTGVDDLRFSQNYQFPSVNENSRWGTRGTSLHYTGTLSATWQHELVVGQSVTTNNFDHHDTTMKTITRRRFSYIDTISRYNVVSNRLTDKSITYSHSVQLHPYHTIKAGLSTQTIRSIFVSSFGVRSFTISKSDTSHNYNAASITVSPFTQYVFDNNRWMVKLGTRANAYSLTGNLYPELRVQAAFKASKNVMLKTSAGNYHQFVSRLQLLGSMRQLNAWIVSNGKNFPVVASRSFMLGTNINLSPTTNLDVELYSRRTSNLTSVYEFYLRNKTGTLSLTRRFITSNNVARGMDLMLRQNLGKIHLWLAYTLSKSQLQGSKINNNNPFNAPDDQRHELKTLCIYRLKHWNFSLSTVLGSGKTWHEAVVSTSVKQARVMNINTYRLPPYFRTDAGTSYSINTAHATLTTGVNIFNIFNTSNLKGRIQKLGENLPDKTLSNQDFFDIADVYGLGIAPNVFLNVKF